MEAKEQGYLTEVSGVGSKRSQILNKIGINSRKKGFWTNKRPGFIYMQGYWENEKKGWTWIPGKWKKINIKTWNNVYSS